MKHDMIARDSDYLIVLDSNVKRKNLFPEILAKTAGFVVLFGLTTYGFFSAVLSTKAHKFYEWIDGIGWVYMAGLSLVGLVVFAIWFLVNKIKGL